MTTRSRVTTGLLRVTVGGVAELLHHVVITDQHGPLRRQGERHRQLSTYLCLCPCLSKRTDLQKGSERDLKKKLFSVVDYMSKYLFAYCRINCKAYHNQQQSKTYSYWSTNERIKSVLMRSLSCKLNLIKSTIINFD